MGTTRVLVGRYLNSITRVPSPSTSVFAAPAPMAVDSLFPMSRLYDGFPSQPCRVSTATGGLEFQYDLQLIANGNFEAAFTGGLPGSTGWAKTAGATLTRSTNDVQEGSFSLMVAGTTANYAYYDWTVLPGEWLKVVGQIHAGTAGQTAKVQIQNLHTGKFLNTDGTWSAYAGTADDNLASTTAEAWTAIDEEFQVESIEACAGAIEVTLRIYFYADTNGATGAPAYDAFALYPATDFVGVFGHNFRAHYDVDWQGSANGGQFVVATDKEQLVVRPDAFYKVATSRYFDRTVALEVDGTFPQIDISGAWIGELVVGQTITLSRRQDWGQEHVHVRPQLRSPAETGDMRAYLLSSSGSQGIRLAFHWNDETSFEEFRDLVMARSANGAYPIIVIPDDADPDVIVYGRPGLTWGYRHGPPLNRRNGAILEVLPLAFPTFVA